MELQMDHRRFDEIAVTWAGGGRSRRAALRGLGAALLGAAAGAAGLGSGGRATARGCFVKGRRCERNGQCCSGTCRKGECAPAPRAERRAATPVSGPRATRSTAAAAAAGASRGNRASMAHASAGQPARTGAGCCDGRLLHRCHLPGGEHRRLLRHGRRNLRCLRQRSGLLRRGLPDRPGLLRQHRGLRQRSGLLRRRLPGMLQHERLRDRPDLPEQRKLRLHLRCAHRLSRLYPTLRSIRAVTDMSEGRRKVRRGAGATSGSDGVQRAAKKPSCPSPLSDGRHRVAIWRRTWTDGSSRTRGDGGGPRRP